MKKYKSQNVTPLLILSVYILSLLTKLIPTSAIDTTAKLFFAVVILELLVFALPSFIYVKLRGTSLETESFFARFSPRKTGFIVSLLMAMLFGGLLINAVFFALGIGRAEYTSVGTALLSEITLKTNPIYALIAYGALPAIAEEFLFRGIILSEYKSCGFTASAVFSSLAFALSYFDLASFPFYFLTGLVLAFAVRITGSLLSAILLRFAANLFSLYLMSPLWEVLTEPLGTVFAIFVILLLFAVFLIIALKSTEKEYRLMATDSAHARDDGISGKKQAERFAKAITAPSFILVLVTYAVAVILGFLLG